MKRKVIRLGPISYAISVPKKWAERFSIEPGMELELIEEADGSLRISPEKGQIQEIAELEIYKTDPVALIYHIVLSHYLHGFKRIILKGELTKSQADFMRIVHREIVGLEAIEVSKDKIVYEDLMYERETDIDSIVKRLFDTLVAMAVELKTALEENKFVGAALEEMDQTVDRFFNLGNRCCNLALHDSAYLRSLNKKIDDILLIHHTIRNLERMGSNLIGLGWYISPRATAMQKERGYRTYKMTKEVRQSVLNFLDSWVKYVSKTKKAYVDRNKELAAEIFGAKHKMRQELLICRGRADSEQLIRIGNVEGPLINHCVQIAQDIMVQRE